MNELYKALYELQGEMLAVKKSSDNPFFKSKYADLNSVYDKLIPALQKRKIGVFQKLDNINGESALVTTLYHLDSDETDTGIMPLILPKNDPQAQGSAITYARRYALVTACGLKAEDDDGQSASNVMSETAKKKRELYTKFIEAGIKTLDDQKLFINSVLGKETVDDEVEADKVIIELGKDN